MKFYEHIEEFDHYLKNYLYNLSSIVPDKLLEAIKYSVLDGGKRLRPMLVFSAGEAVGGNYKKLFAVATSLEFIHAYSLVHDDLPCMDDDDLRRGKPTCHKAFGYGMAVLTGDALLNLAYEILSQNPEKLDDNVMVNIINTVSTAAGSCGMVAGQCLDINGNVEDIETMHSLKTGALFVSALKAGAIASGASAKEIDCLVQYGKNIGLAFQITDDILDVTGKVEIIGKNINHDENKTTYVTLYGIEGAREKARIVTELALNYANKLKQPEKLQELASYILNRDK